MKKTILLLSAVVVFLSSCAPKIDGSSEQAMKSSIEKIKKSLSEEKKEKFEEAIKLITFQDLDLGTLLQGGAGGLVSDIKSKLHGKTADDIIAEGEGIKKEIERKEKEQAKGEIEELYKKKVQSENDKKELEKFVVKSSRLYREKAGYYSIREQVIIELTVLNTTDNAISRAYFTGILASPDRNVPWHKGSFNYQISGGLEPGEESTWVLAPNMFSDWGSVDAPKDAVLTVEVKQLDGPNDEVLYTVNSFGEEEQKRLEELLSSYPEFKK